MKETRQAEKPSGPARRTRHSERNDLTGEHPFGDAGQALLLLFFLGIWCVDSFLLEATTWLNGIVSPWLRIPAGILLVVLSVTLSAAGMRVVFGEVRDKPAVIRKGVFRLIRHPIYSGEILAYLGLLCFSISAAAFAVWLLAVFFLYFISRHEERLLLARFGDEYRSYMRETGMFLPRLRKKTDL